jgi:circadian clock protein KaiB
MSTSAPAGAVVEAAMSAETWELRLYVTGRSPKCVRAIDNLRRVCEAPGKQLCDAELEGQVDFEVVDIRRQPALVVRDRVIAAPTLIKRLPGRLRRLVGDLSDANRVRLGLDLGPIDVSDSQPAGQAGPKAMALSTPDRAVDSAPQEGYQTKPRSWPN